MTPRPDRLQTRGESALPPPLTVATRLGRYRMASPVLAAPCCGLRETNCGLPTVSKDFVWQCPKSRHDSVCDCQQSCEIGSTSTGCARADEGRCVDSSDFFVPLGSCAGLSSYDD